MNSNERPQKEGEFESARWWENYAVRYFVGTAVGVLIVAFLSREDHPLRNLVLSTPNTFPKDLDARSLVALAAAGLAYCYIASAPMLSLHATRSQLFREGTRFTWRFWLLLISGIVCIPLCLLIKMCVSNVILAFIFGSQLFLIVTAHLDNFSSVKTLYKNLSKNRAEEKKKSDYLESYRHLREHSNAYGIIVLEVLLAISLASISNLQQLVLILLLWLLPPAYCWFIATVLEIDLAQRS